MPRNSSHMSSSVEKKWRRPLGILALFASLGMMLATCATPTPYQPAANKGGGYTEKLLETNRYRISFQGNSLTSRDTVEDYLLYRAAELTIETGNDYFIMVERDTDEKTNYSSTYRDPWPYYGPYNSLGHYRYPYWMGYERDVYTRAITRYNATADIVVYAGQKPADDPYAYDARQIMDNLGPGLIRPQDLAS